MNEPLLSRTEFKDAVFKRDGGRCVNCKEEAVDAHHLLERRLWKDGGYYISNGVSLCELCHKLAEETTLSVEELREKADIFNIVIPNHFSKDEKYDKWGNIIYENGTRFKGELFYDSSVQKVLKQSFNLNKFVNYIKYPRTYHLPWSQSIANDDKIMKNMANFIGEEVVVTAKMDGENTTIYSDGYIHARSIDGRNHPSRDWLKNFAQTFAYDIPVGWRVCGENLYAKHSIEYTDLESYFLGFSIWDAHNICMSWNETVTYFNLLGISHVPVLYRGIYDENIIKTLWNEKMRGQHEGYVVRLAGNIAFKDFGKSFAKFVRKNHIETGKQHWYFQEIITNKLKGE